MSSKSGSADSAIVGPSLSIRASEDFETSAVQKTWKIFVCKHFDFLFHFDFYKVRMQEIFQYKKIILNNRMLLSNLKWTNNAWAGNKVSRLQGIWTRTRNSQGFLYRSHLLNAVTQNIGKIWICMRFCLFWFTFQLFLLFFMAFIWKILTEIKTKQSKRVKIQIFPIFCQWLVKWPTKNLILSC